MRDKSLSGWDRGQEWKEVEGSRDHRVMAKAQGTGGRSDSWEGWLG